ncbi:MAG: cytochrome c oxidase subunit 3 [Halocynthiibacter sp.]
MAHVKNHDYHILNPSIWPFLAAVGAFIMLTGAVFMLTGSTPWVFFAGLAMVLYVSFAWWSDVIAESHDGDHTPVVRIGLRYGFVLFIMSEIMFFVAWFWSFFKPTMYPMDTYKGTEWVAPHLDVIDPFHLPLINTLILLLSGAAVTWAHHALVHENNRKDLVNGLTLAIILGVCFTFLQAYEYSHMTWWVQDGAQPSAFVLATMFHGFHVVVGTIFLAVCLFRALKGHFTPERHVGFEAAAWYWHFVDVVWLFLFVAVYIWGL